MTRGRLGRAGLPVSELAFGGSAIGNLERPVDPAVAEAAVTAARTAGVRYFDTAPHYGLGLSERRLGAALRGVPRADYVLSTKVGRLLVTNPAPSGSDQLIEGFAVPDDLVRVEDYSRDGVLRSVEESLGRLGVDRLDVVYLHDAEDHLAQALTEAAPALVELREQGVVGAVGAAMNYWEHLLRFATGTDLDVLLLAGQWTLLERSGRPLLDACLRRGISVVAAAPYNSGILARPWPPDDAHYRYRPAGRGRLTTAREMARACSAAGVSLPAAAVQFPLRHPAVACVLAGLRSPDEVAAAVAGLREPIPPALWDELDALRLSLDTRWSE
jgi:D-threo-aldose 1-dehydrogenase